MIFRIGSAIHDFEDRFDYWTSQEWREQITTLIIEDGVAEIPENVEYIDDEAFLGCTGLRRVLLRSRYIKDDRWLPEALKARVRIERCGA